MSTSVKTELYRKYVGTVYTMTIFFTGTELELDYNCVEPTISIIQLRHKGPA